MTIANLDTLDVIDDGAARAAEFGALYEQHVGDVYRCVHRRCRDRALAEEVTQDAFLTAIRTVDDPGEITIGWLMTVARHGVVDVLRRQSVHTGKLRLVTPPASGPDEAEEVIGRMTTGAAFERLGVEHRLVLMLHYVDGLTIAQLAEHLGRSSKAAESLITRARRSPRRELEGSHA